MRFVANVWPGSGTGPQMGANNLKMINRIVHLCFTFPKCVLWLSSGLARGPTSPRMGSPNQKTNTRFIHLRFTLSKMRVVAHAWPSSGILPSREDGLPATNTVGLVRHASRGRRRLTATRAVGLRDWSRERRRFTATPTARVHRSRERR